MGRFVSVSRPKYALTSILDIFKKKETEKLIKEKTYLGSGAMTLPPYIPCSGFVPGQTIQITIELDNSSNVDVDYIRIRVERIWKIKANTSSKSKKSNIVKKVMVLNPVEKHTPIKLMVQIQIPKRQIILHFKYCGILTDPFTLHVETCSR